MGDLNIEDLKENKNTLTTARKMKDKYKRLSRKRKIQKSQDPVVFEGVFQKTIKKPKTSTKSALVAARKISKKYKKLRYR